MLKTQLLDLGFTEKEALVYLELNRIGPMAASTLARLTNLKRTSMYDILNALLQRNVITRYVKNGTTFYYIDDVSKVLHREKERVQTAEEVIKKLKEEQVESHRVSVYHYQGPEGYREMYEDILKAKPKELLGWLHLDEFYKHLDPKREVEWTKERIQSKIYARLLMQRTKLTEDFKLDDPKSHRETRLIPKENMFKTTCFLYDGNITFLDPTKEVTGIRIEDKELYEMQKQLFEMNWNYLSSLVQG